MNVISSNDPLHAIETDVAIAPVFAGDPLPKAAAALIEPDDFPARFKQTLLLFTRPAASTIEVSPSGGIQGAAGSMSARRLLLVGLGKRSEITAERLRQAIAVAASAVTEARAQRIAVEVPRTESVSQADATRAVADGVLLSLYRFERFKGAASKKDGDDKLQVEELTLAGGDEEQARLAQIVAGGVKLARDLGNEPPEVCTPSRLAHAAEEIAQRGNMQITVLDRPQMQELGMGGLLGVAAGTQEPPKFIVLEYGRKGQGKTLALVGKGITFDSGGISIKPGERMDEMKMDMMGAGAVMGAMSAIADLKPANVHVVGIVASTENLPSGTAFVPGDILKAMNGVTMEILNTDAEGRLVLADALSYAQRFEPDGIVDLATLTGACVVALGHHISALMTNNPEFAARVKAAGQQTGELVWELPILPEHREQIKSKVADIKNTGGRPGGAITAAAFLENFVDDRPWAHLDIAGTAIAHDNPKPYARYGATGFGVRLLVELVRSFAAA